MIKSFGTNCISIAYPYYYFKSSDQNIKGLPKNILISAQTHGAFFLNVYYIKL